LIQHHDGFSSLLKAAPKGVIFAITGIATTERELVRDHKSIDRQLDTGKLPVKTMEPADLLRVVATAEALIKNEILYAEDAKTELIRLVAGQPYLLHLIGRESLLQAFRTKKKAISSQDLQDALTEIAAKKTDSELENQYLKSIGNSAQREIVLRAFARTCRPNTHTSLAYPIAESQGVTNVSYYVTDLQKVNFGEPLKKVNEKVYSFRDPLFQAYVAATPCRLSQEKSSPEPPKLSSVGQSFEILHISDTHFGQAHFFSNLPSAKDALPSTDKPSLEKFLTKAVQKENLKPNLLVISGDLTQRGTTDEFNRAKSSISAILRCLKDSGVATELIVTPGNHDVNWALQQGDSDPSMAFVPYVNFRNSLMTRARIDLPIMPERLYEVSAHQFENAKVIVVTFNSAVLISKNDQRGYIGDSQLDNAFLEVNALDPEVQAIRIAIFHHHLIPVHSVESEVIAELLLADASQVKKRLLKERCSIAMHGHRHQGHEESVGDGESSLVVIGCGSSAVVVPERGSQPLQFNSISVQLLKEAVGIQVRRFLFDVTHAEWLPHAVKTFSIARP
jgi:predicted MPP superfamily phosphohydrolase